MSQQSDLADGFYARLSTCPGRFSSACAGVRTLRGRFTNTISPRFSLGAPIALLLAFPLVFFLFVAPANEAFRLAAPTSVPQLDRVAPELGKRSQHPFRSAVGRTRLAILSVPVEVRQRTGQRAQRMSEWGFQMGHILTYDILLRTPFCKVL
jgi:hypothetical protein